MTRDSTQTVIAKRVGETHVVFEALDARWIMRLDKPAGEPPQFNELLCLHGLVTVQCDGDGVVRMTVPRITMRSRLSRFDQDDVVVWRRVPLLYHAERLDEVRARVMWLSGPTPPDAPPCLGIAASRWPSPDPTTTFELPSGGSVVALLRPSNPYGAGRGEWMPLRVRREESALVATYDYERERRFSSLAQFLDAHRVATRDVMLLAGSCADSYEKQSPRALAALAEMVGLAWRPTHRIEWCDLDSGAHDVWFVDAGRSLAEHGPTPAPAFAEALYSECATFAYDPEAEASGDMSAGWRRDGVALADAFADTQRVRYDIEALD